MGILGNIDRQKMIQLIIGVVGLNSVFIVIAMLIQRITALPYTNSFNGRQQIFKSSSGLILMQRGATWILAIIWNRFTVPTQSKIKQQMKNIQLLGVLICFTSICYYQAIYLVSFPVAAIFKSSNILIVVLVGAFCSSVTHKQSKLKPHKIIIGLIITAGIIVYTLFDPQFTKDHFLKSGKNPNAQIIGIFLLITSLFCDGFVADYQQQIKLAYRPHPGQMLMQANKWCTMACFIYTVLKGQFLYTLQFCFRHHLMALHLFIICILFFIAQVFQYKMVSQFRQHIVPFTFAIRRILNVVISILFYHHKTSFWMIAGIVIVFLAISFEFLLQVLSDQKKQGDQPKPLENAKIQQNQLELTTKQEKSLK